MLVNQTATLEDLFGGAGMVSAVLSERIKSAKTLRYAVTNNEDAQNAALRADAFQLLSHSLTGEADANAAAAALEACVAIISGNHRSQLEARTSGVLNRIAAILSSSGGGNYSERLLLAACTALGVACVGQGNSQELAQGLGCIKSLIALAQHSPFLSVRQRSLFALGCLGADNAAVRSHIVMAGGLRATLALLPARVAHKDASAQVSCLQTLAALRGLTNAHPEAQLDVIAAGGYALIAQLIRPSSPNHVAAAACQTLGVLCRGISHTRQRLQAEVAVRDLGAVLARLEDADADGARAIGGVAGESPSSQDAFCAAACAAVGTISAGDPFCQQAASTSGAVGSLLSLSRATHRDVLVSDAAIEALASVIGGDEGRQQVASASGLVSTLVRRVQAEQRRMERQRVGGRLLPPLRSGLFSAAPAHVPPLSDRACPGAVFGLLAALCDADASARHEVLRSVEPGAWVWLHMLRVRLNEIPAELCPPLQGVPFRGHPTTSGLAAAREAEEAAAALATLVGCLAAHDDGNLLPSSASESPPSVESPPTAESRPSESPTPAPSTLAQPTPAQPQLRAEYLADDGSSARPLTPYEIGPLVAMIRTEGEVARAAIACLLQLLSPGRAADSTHEDGGGLGQGAGGFRVAPQTVIKALQGVDSGGVFSYDAPLEASSPSSDALADLVRLLGAPAVTSDPSESSSQAHLRQAAAALTLQIRTSVPSVCGLLLAAGAPQALVHSLSAPKGSPPGAAPDAMAGSAAALTSLAALSALINGDRSSQDAAREAGALPALLGLLRTGCHDARLRALHCLASLAARNPATREAVRAANGLQVVVSLFSPRESLGRGGAHHHLADHAAIALTHLTASCYDNQRLVEEAGGVVALACLAQHHESRGNEHARAISERALYECAFDNADVGQAVGQARGAAAAGLIAFERPEEWGAFRRGDLKARDDMRCASRRAGAGAQAAMPRHVLVEIHPQPGGRDKDFGGDPFLSVVRVV